MPFTVHSLLRRVGLWTALHWTVLEVGSIVSASNWGASSGGGGQARPHRTQRLQMAYFWEHPSCRAAILCQVELATSEV